MTYSVESLVFRAAVGVVNGAACAVNHLLEVMYPREDIGAIWLDVPAGASGGPAPTGSTPGGVADSAGDAAPPQASPAGSLTADDLRYAAMYVRYWSESDNCDDTTDNLKHLRELAARLEEAAGESAVLLW